MRVLIALFLVFALTLFSPINGAHICESGLQYCVEECIGCGRIGGTSICTNPLCAGNCKDNYCLGGCTPSIPVCDVINDLRGFYDDLSSRSQDLLDVFNGVVEEIQDIDDQLASVGQQIAYFTDNTLDFGAAFEGFADGVSELGDFITDVAVVRLVQRFSAIGAEFSKVIQAVGSIDFDVGVFEDAGSGLMSTADTIFSWIVNGLTVPANGVFRNDVTDCWWEALNDGSVCWSVGLATGPNLNLGFCLTGNKPLKCFLSKARLFSSALAAAEPEFPNLDPTLALREALKGLKQLMQDAGSFDGERPAWCDSNMFIDIDIPETPFDWLNVFLEGVEKINLVIGEDGAIGTAVGAIKSIICDAASIPTEIENWADGMLESLESRKLHIPSALVNRLFNAVSDFGEKFTKDLDTFEEDYLGSNATSTNCFKNFWDTNKITISFGLSLEINVFPPKPANIGVSFSCLGIDCWGCVTGISKVIELVTGKRDIEILRDGQGAGATISFMTDDYSNVGLNRCTQYRCDNGVWNENICTCRCNRATDIWTPQYGCFDRIAYQNGDAPKGANPAANPNNPNYDATVDPYSSEYDASKDKNPYYDPFETASGMTISIVFALLSLAILL